MSTNREAVLQLAVLCCLVGVTCAVYSNPCRSAYESCNSQTLTDQCGYGSACVSPSNYTCGSGVCRYLSANLTCGTECPLHNTTGGGTLYAGCNDFYPTELSCAAGAVCTKSVSESHSYCSIGTVDQTTTTSFTQWAPIGCPCTSEDIQQKCASGSCTAGVCAVASSTRGGYGFPCSVDTDCLQTIGQGDASLTCSGGYCSGLALGAVCGVANGQCGKGLDCAGTFGSKTCQNYRQIGESCSTAASAIHCVPYGRCDSVGLICVNLFDTPDGSACTSASHCKPGHACVGSVCVDGGYCDQTGPSTCPSGLTCGCTAGSITPACVGANMTVACADLYNSYRRCLEENGTMFSFGVGSGRPINMMPTPDACRCKFKQLFCNTTCPASQLQTMFGASLDYKMMDCCAGEWKSTSLTVANMCYRPYCRRASFDSVSDLGSCSSDPTADPCYVVPAPPSSSSSSTGVAHPSSSSSTAVKRSSSSSSTAVSSSSSSSSTALAAVIAAVSDGLSTGVIVAIIIPVVVVMAGIMVLIGWCTSRNPSSSSDRDQL